MTGPSPLLLSPPCRCPAPSPPDAAGLRVAPPCRQQRPFARGAWGAPAAPRVSPRSLEGGGRLGVSGRIPGIHSCPYFQKLPGLEGRGRPGRSFLACRAPLGRRPAGVCRWRSGRRRGWTRVVAAGRGSPCSSPLSSAPLLLVSLADAAARGGGSSRGTRGRERG